MVQVSHAALVGNPPIKPWTAQRISQGRVIRDSDVRFVREADICAAPETGGAIRSRRRLGRLVVALS